MNANSNYIDTLETETDGENFIEETLVVDFTYYENIKEEITCIICCGILNNPIMCESCETHYCQACIEKWKKADRGCPKKCPKPIVLKKMVRSFRNLIDKVMLRCKACKENISLLNYPEHIKPCTEKNSFISCPFCKNCRLNKDKLQIDDNMETHLVESILKQKSIMENKFAEYRINSDNSKKNLDKKIAKLEQELIDNRFMREEELKKLKVENLKYIKEAHDKTMENFNLMKEVEKLMVAEKLNFEKKKSLEKKNSYVEKRLVTEFMSIPQSEVITSVISIPFNYETFIVSAGRDKLIRVWSLSNLEKPLMILRGHTKYINVLTAFFYDNEWLLASSGLDKTIKVWKLLGTDQCLVTIKAHIEAINTLTSIVWKGNTLIASGSQDNSVRLWKIENCDLPIFVLKGHNLPVFALEVILINNEQHLVSGSKDQTIKIWDLNYPSQPVLILKDHSDTIFALKTMQYKGNQVIASGSRDQTIKIWLVNQLSSNEKPIVTLRGHFDYVRVLTTIVINGEELLVSGSWDKTIKIWSLDNPENALQTLKGHTDYVIALNSFVYKGDNMILSGSQDMTIKIFK